MIGEIKRLLSWTTSGMLRLQVDMPRQMVTGHSRDGPKFSRLLPLEAERLYAKDAPCPERWHAWMIENLPGYLLPFGTGDLSGYLSPEVSISTSNRQPHIDRL